MRGYEPEPQVVAERLWSISARTDADGEEEVWVAPVGKPVVAESRVALVTEKAEMAEARLTKNKRRRVIGVSGDEAVEVEGKRGIIMVTSIKGG